MSFFTPEQQREVVRIAGRMIADFAKRANWDAPHEIDEWAAEAIKAELTRGCLDD